MTLFYLRRRFLFCLAGAALFALCFSACKKKEYVPSAAPEIRSYAAEYGAIADVITSDKKVVVSIDDRVDATHLNVFFELSPGATATINGALQKSGQAVDLTSPLTYTVKAPDGTTADWQVILKSNVSEIGLGTVITAQKHNDLPYEWYQDQDSSGRNSLYNGGWACVAMAAFWSNPQYRISTEQLVSTSRAGGGSLSTMDIFTMLSTRSVPCKFVNLPNEIQTIKTLVDKGYILVLCLDMQQITYNFYPYHHTERFYETGRRGGHFVIVKGYRETNNKYFWLETYDPLNNGACYADKTPKGKDRYYLSTSVQAATNRMWDYAIVVGKSFRIMDKLDTEISAADVLDKDGY